MGVPVGSGVFVGKGVGVIRGVGVGEGMTFTGGAMVRIIFVGSGSGVVGVADSPPAISFDVSYFISFKGETAGFSGKASRDSGGFSRRDDIHPGTNNTAITMRQTQRIAINKHPMRRGGR